MIRRRISERRDPRAGAAQTRPKTRIKWLINKKTLKKCAKCVLTALVVAAIALLLMTLGEDARVPSTQADIVTGLFAPASKTARFGDALRAMGHPEPLALDLNGNRVFFSTREISASPEASLCEYQAEFMRQGVNEKAFCELSAFDKLQRQRVGLTGGVVPMLVSPQRVVMSGVEQRNNEDSAAMLFGRANLDRPMAEIFGAYRVVEIVKDAGASTSTVLAMWSDEDFDYARMLPAGREQVRKEVDPLVPICTGCQLLNTLGDAAVEGLYRAYTFSATQSDEQIQSYYQQELAARGWVEAAHASSFERIAQVANPEQAFLQPLVYQREDAMLTVQIYPLEEPAGTGIHVVLMDREYLETKKLRPLQANQDIEVDSFRDAN